MIDRASRRVSPSLSLAIALTALVSCSNTDTHAPSIEDGGGTDSGSSCVDPASGPPTDVFCIGLYQGRDVARYATSARPYTPGVVLWSDGAEKQRFLYLPPSTSIDTSDMDAWKFPAGTKAYKEFRLNGVLVETRLLWKRNASTWETATYIWNDTQTDATLNTARTPTVVADGYEIPDAKDCGKCHHGASDKLLGVEAVALALPSAEGVTLDVLARGGQLSQPPDPTTVPLPEDATGKAAAVGFLHANCGMPCHSSRGLGEETQLLLRVRANDLWPIGDATTPAGAVTETDAFLASFEQPPTTAAVAQAFPGALRIIPGSHDKSLLWLLAHRRGDYQMPPLVSHKVDEASTQKLADWIDALTP
jgi:hypothetical protein